MIPKINTGTPRNVLGHIVSGALASAIVSGTINYKKTMQKQMSPNEAIKDTVKKTTQGGIATGSAIAAANFLGQPNGLMKALTAVSVGMAGIYAVEILDEKLGNAYSELSQDDELPQMQEVNELEGEEINE
ncbi:hypothetical protein A9Q76_07255 [Arcobacter sp. 31_11_sub10_T18]|nr:hypothetical protein A9Q76_07255 [Arcobacter sp. 31_11_sub10_T18]